MKILVLGDIHLGQNINVGRPGVGTELNSRILDQLSLLEWVREQAINFKTDCIIITGDVFEHPKPEHSLIVLFTEWLRSCVSANIKVYIVIGNHDILRSAQFYTSALDIIGNMEIDGVSIYKNIDTLHLNDVSITFLPFRDRRSLNTDSNEQALEYIKNILIYELSSIKKDNFKLMVGHLSIDGSIPIGDEVDDMMNELYVPLSFFEGYDYVWFGHVHRFQEFSKSNPYISHIGSMSISNWGEINQNKFIALFDTNNAEPLHYVEIPNRKLLSISIEIPENVADVNSFICTQIDAFDIKNTIVKLTLILPNQDIKIMDKSALEKYLYDNKAHFVFRIIEERKMIVKKKNNTISIDNTINEGVAIKLYADLNIEDKYKGEFIDLANSIIKEHLLTKGS